MTVKGTSEEIRALKATVISGILERFNSKSGEYTCEGGNCSDCILRCKDIAEHIGDVDLIERNPFNEKFVTVVIHA